MTILFYFSRFIDKNTAKKRQPKDAKMILKGK